MTRWCRPTWISLLFTAIAACGGGGDGQRTRLVDEDGDGFFADAPNAADADCDDNPVDGAAINPAAEELCDGLDNDCNGTIDDDYAVDAVEYWRDKDGDGFGIRGDGPRLACRLPEDFSPNRRDCNDADDEVYPGAPERCNDADDNCNTIVDEGFSKDDEWFLDGDGDGFGGGESLGDGCALDPRWVRDNSDCNDANRRIRPGAPEVCDGVDNDCNLLVDAEDTDEEVLGTRALYPDVDEDGYGNILFPERFCPGDDVPAGFVDNADDCDDRDSRINPDTIWYVDADRDGFAVANATYPTPRCDRPLGHSLEIGDCDDSDPDSWTTKLWYPDADRDGFGGQTPVAQGCGQRDGWVSDNRDCNDRDPAINPLATEVCDGGIDNDCNGTADDGEEEIVPLGRTSFWADQDGDGYGAFWWETLACEAPDGFVDNDEDCDDDNASRNPDSVWYPDADRDGFGANGSTGVTGCEVVPGHVVGQGDCDDTDFDRNDDTPWYTDDDGDGLGVGSEPEAFGCLDGTPGLAPVTGDCDDDDPSDDDGGCFGPALGTLTVLYDVDSDVFGVRVRATCDGVNYDRLLTNTDANSLVRFEVNVPEHFPTDTACTVEIRGRSVDQSGDGRGSAEILTCDQRVATLVPQTDTARTPTFEIQRCSGCDDPAATNYDPSVLIPTNDESCLY